MVRSGSAFLILPWENSWFAIPENRVLLPGFSIVGEEQGNGKDGNFTRNNTRNIRSIFVTQRFI